MKLLSFGPPGRERPGALLDRDTILDLGAHLPGRPASLRRALEEGIPPLPPGREGIDPAHCVPLREVRLAAPIPEPSKILCVGLNYRDHAAEQNKPLPERPLIFCKVPSAVTAPEEAIRLPDPGLETFVDPEAELAVVIGRRASRISVEQSHEYVAGYTCLNDVSGRDTQKAERQWVRAKGFDTFAPLGPWIVTPGEIPDPGTLDVIGRVNGEVRQRSNTRNLIFDVPFLIAYLSRSMTLLPGDVIATGTPGGVGVHRKPPVRLRAGDTVEVEIPGIGILKNRVLEG